jgi:Concanavalin A-like lectin/glucanases superfamily/Immunoglobulin domain
MNSKNLCENVRRAVQSKMSTAASSGVAKRTGEKHPYFRSSCGSIVIALFVVLAGALFPANAQDPVVWLRADGNLLDSSGSNNNAVAVDPVIFTAGHSGQAFLTEGGFIRVTDAPDLRPASTVTVQAWVKSFTTLSGETSRYILSKSRASGSASYAFYTASGGGLAFYVEKGSSLVVTPQATSAALWDNNWHQITGVYDGTNAILYLDGALVGATTTTNAGTLTYSTAQNNGDLLIGNYNPVIGGSTAFIGTIDDVKIFNTAMSAVDVLDTFNNASSPAGTNGLVAWYQGEGNAVDSWGNHNGTLPGSATVTYFAGKSGQGLLSPNGAVQIPDSNGVLDSPDLTVQAWVQSVAPGTFKYILCKAKEGQPTFGLYTASGGGAAFFINLNGANALSVSPQAPPNAVWDGAWHQLTGVYDGSIVHLYLDGVEEGTGTAASGPIAYSTNFLGGNLLIGNDEHFSFPYGGVVDDVKIYDQALTASEILATYNSASNLVSWWAAEGNANDTFGLNNGSLSGTVSYVAGREVGQAFRTTAGAVVIPDSSSLQVSNVTVEAVISGSAPGANRYVISKSCTSSSASYALYSGADGGLVFYVTLPGGVVSSAEAPADMIWDGNFHAVAGTYDGTAVRLYVDGTQVGNDASGSGPIQYGTSQSSGELLFGDFADSLTTSNNFNGIIDEVKVYDSGLSAAAVKADAFQPLIITAQPTNTLAVQGSQATMSVAVFGQTPLYFQWLFNGTNISGGTNSTLTLTNVQPANSGQYSVSVTTKSLGYTNSALGAGEAFQMSGGAVDVPNDPTLQPANLSVQCWVRSASQPGNTKYILSKSRGTGVSSYAFYTGSDGGLKFYICIGGSSFVVSQTISNNIIWDGQWHRVTGTFTDLGTVHIYLDGVEVGTGIDSFFGSIDYTPGAYSGDLWLGDFSALSTANHFSGDVDEVKIFDHELSASDVADTFTNSSSAAATNGLISWWAGDGNALDKWGSNNGRPLPLPGTILSQDATLTVISPAILSNPGIVSGHFQATVTGTPAINYTITRSSDLSNWTPVATNASPFIFTDPTPVNSNEFYRAVYQ